MPTLLGHPAAMPEPQFPALENALAERQKGTRVTAIIVLVLAVGLTGGLYAVGSDGVSERRFAKALMQGGALIVGSLGFMIWAYTHKPRNNRLYRAVVERPHDIVWLYEKQTNGVVALVAALTDKKRLSINIEVPETREAVWDELSVAVPHANTGWSARKERAYLEDPKRLTEAVAQPLANLSPNA